MLGLLAIVNGTFTRSFARSAVSAVALTSVAISAVGILEVVFADYMPAHSSPMETGLGMMPTGISSTLGSPVALATYLLLGVPCVLCSLSRAHTREGKLQVELAQLRYALPRLAHKTTALSRLMGGVGGRGE